MPDRSDWKYRTDKPKPPVVVTKPAKHRIPPPTIWFMRALLHGYGEGEAPWLQW